MVRPTNASRPYESAWGVPSPVGYGRKRRPFEPGGTILLEHKNSEPALKIRMRDVGMTLYVVHALQAMGVDSSGVKVNFDWQHLHMNGEHVPEYIVLLSDTIRLGHLHANSGWGAFGDDDMVGATQFMTTLEIAKTLQLAARIGDVTLDEARRTKDAVAAYRIIYAALGLDEGFRERIRSRG